MPPMMAPSRARYDPRRGRLTGSIFGSPESQDRAAFLDEGMRQYDDEYRQGLQINPIKPVFDALRRQELGAAYDGKKFGVSGMGQGVTTNRTAMTGGAMPARARKPADYLDDGRFDITDDPRVQQAMTRQALDALDDSRFDRADARIAQGREEYESTPGVKESRALRLGREFAVPMANVRADVGDIESEREARRNSLPWRAGEMDRDFQRRRELATLPAQIAAEGKERVASITGDSRVDAAAARNPSQIEILLEALGLSAKGGWGVDADGRPMAPPADLQQRARDLLTQPGQQPSGPPARGGGAGPAVSQGPPANPKPGDKYRMANGKIAVWANDDGTWGWYEDDGG